MFIQFQYIYVWIDIGYLVNFLNEKKLTATEIREHPICDSFLRSYKTCWYDELIDFLNISWIERVVDFTMEDRLEDMIRNIGTKLLPKRMYETTSTNANTLLYVGLPMGGSIRVSHNCSFCWMKCFQMKKLWG